jgi:putative oxidoreductase
LNSGKQNTIRNDGFKDSKHVAVFRLILFNQLMLTTMIKLHSYLVKTASFLQSPFLLLIRLVWGYQFFEAGLGKLQDIEKFVKVLTELNVPMPQVNAYLAAGTECVGGFLMMLGLFSRIISIPLVFTMIVAYATAHNADVQALFNGDPEAFFAASPFLFLFSTLIVLIFGPGAISLDRLIDLLFIKGKKGKS